MYANNEIGVINPIAEIGKIAKEHGIFFAVDGVQAVAKCRWTSRRTTSTCWPSAGTRFTGPRALALCTSAAQSRVQLSAIIDGGGHERGMRSGTLNVPGIVGLGKACESRKKRCRKKRRVCSACASVSERPGSQAGRGFHQRLDGTPPAEQPEHELCYVEGESLLMGINDIAVSSGSACTSATLEPSYVIQSIRSRRRPRPHLDSVRPGSFQHARGSRLRHRQDGAVVTKLRELSPLYEMAKEGTTSRK